DRDKQKSYKQSRKNSDLLHGIYPPFLLSKKKRPAAPARCKTGRRRLQYFLPHSNVQRLRTKQKRPATPHLVSNWTSSSSRICAAQRCATRDRCSPAATRCQDLLWRGQLSFGPLCDHNPNLSRRCRLIPTKLDVNAFTDSQESGINTWVLSPRLLQNP